MIVKVTSNKAFPCSVISIQDVLVSGLPSCTPPVVVGLLPRGDTAQVPASAAPSAVPCL